jgi:hypothetical protein
MTIQPEEVHLRKGRKFSELSKLFKFDGSQILRKIWRKVAPKKRKTAKSDHPVAHFGSTAIFFLAKKLVA